MENVVLLLINSILLGVGLAMDAFSVSMTNGLNEPKMKFGRMCLIAGCYGFFQFAMPMTGWVCVHTIAEKFTKFQPFIPWIALLLLLYVGGKMLIEGIRELKTKNSQENSNEQTLKALGFGTLLVQGIATSIDALSVGFTIAEYAVLEALLSSIIIAVVTFGICIGGLIIGKKIGDKLSDKASILGGIILIGIGLEIWIKGFVIPLCSH